MALTQVAGLPMRDARAVLAGMHGQPPLMTMKLAQEATLATTLEPTAASAETRRDTMAALAAAGWPTPKPSPALDHLVSVVENLRRLGHPELVALLTEWAPAAESIARADLAAIATDGDQDEVAEAVVLGIVLGAQMLHALRLLAQTRLAVEAEPASPPPARATRATRATPATQATRATGRITP